MKQKNIMMTSLLISSIAIAFAFNWAKWTCWMVFGISVINIINGVIEIRRIKNHE